MFKEIYEAYSIYYPVDQEWFNKNSGFLILK